MEEIRPFTPLELSLIRSAEQALENGALILAWWKDRWASGGPDIFPIRQDGGARATMEGFFDQLEIGGRLTSVMGCLQTLRFGPAAADRAELPEVHIDEFISRSFLTVSEWRRRDGHPGGFGYKPLLYKSQGSYKRFPGDRALDLSEVGSRYDCVVLLVEIHDFVRSFAPLRPFARHLSSFIREAAYIVVEAGYMRDTFPRSDDAAVVMGMGYSFVPLIVHPNFFGYGPGRFGTAIKLYRFAVLKSGELEIKLAFLSAPRSQKVLYFGGFDPVYSFVHLLDRLTLGKLGIRKRVHDRFDSMMLRQHGQVHQDFLTGLQPKWEGHRWIVPPDGSDRL